MYLKKGTPAGRRWIAVACWSVGEVQLSSNSKYIFGNSCLVIQLIKGSYYQNNSVRFDFT